MTAPMTHDEIRDLLAAEAAGALDPAERAALTAHLEGCAECVDELRALADTASLLAYSAPAAELDVDASARMRARLVARAAADRAPVAAAFPSLLVNATATEPESVIPITRARRGGWGGWLAAAASLLLLLGIGTYAGRLRARVAELESATAALRAERGRLQGRVAENERTLASLSGPDVRVVTLAGGRTAPNGRMFWDPPTGRWTFFAHNLPAVRPGREYQLWLVTADHKISAGTFRPGPRGDAMVQAEYKLDPAALQAIAVTEEPAGGLPAPSGDIVLVGATAGG